MDSSGPLSISYLLVLNQHYFALLGQVMGNQVSRLRRDLTSSRHSDVPKGPKNQDTKLGVVETSDRDANAQQKPEVEVPDAPSRASSNASSITALEWQPSTRSMVSGLRYEGGRRYHGVEDSPYPIPNDIMEQERLHIQHYLIKYTLKGNFQSPIAELLRQGRKVLDVGCGPGVWIMDMANDFPNSEFHGVDISPIFPEAIKPPNTFFQLGNILERLPFDDNTFDFVHQRALVGALTVEHWPLAMKELVRVTKPGGWIELVELDAYFCNVGPIWTKLVVNGLLSALRGRNLDGGVAKRIGQLLQDASVVGVSSDYRSMPLNWGGKIGEIHAKDWKEGAASFGPWLSKVLNMTEEDYNAEWEAAIEECKTTGTYGDLYWACGQAPAAIEK